MRADVVFARGTGEAAGLGSVGYPGPARPRVVAVVVFGNPLGLQRETIKSAGPAYGPKADDCNTGDTVWGNGCNVAAHLQYVSNGSAAKGTTFAAGRAS